MGLFDDPFKIEKQDWELKAEEDEKLCAAGIKVKIENWKGRQHNKIIFADTLVPGHESSIIGSMNFSNSGNNKNDENLLYIKNNSIFIQELNSDFKSKWNDLPESTLCSNSHSTNEEMPALN